MNLRRWSEGIGPGGRSLRAVAVYVVRHACAGDKNEWAGPDDERPLDEVGRRQAQALADMLATAPVRRIVSSPALRCRESVEPLARRLGLEIELHDVLRNDAAPLPLHDLLAEVRAADAGTPGDVILCVHGELMRPLLAELRETGVPIVSRGSRDHDALLAKGSAWRLARQADGTVTSVEHMVPVELPRCTAHSWA